jgi:hypothetical protein
MCGCTHDDRGNYQRGEVVPDHVIAPSGWCSTCGAARCDQVAEPPTDGRQECWCRGTPPRWPHTCDPEPPAGDDLERKVRAALVDAFSADGYEIVDDWYVGRAVPVVVRLVEEERAGLVEYDEIADETRAAVVEVRKAALLEAADAIQAMHPGETKASDPLPVPDHRRPRRAHAVNGCPECGSAVPNIRHLLDADAHPCDNPWHDPPKGRAGASGPAPSSEKAEAERDEWRAAHARALRDREAVETEMDRRLGEAWAERDAAHREVADLLAVVGGVRAALGDDDCPHGYEVGEDGCDCTVCRVRAALRARAAAQTPPPGASDG